VHQRLPTLLSPAALQQQQEPGRTASTSNYSNVCTSSTKEGLLVAVRQQAELVGVQTGACRAVPVTCMGCQLQLQQGPAWVMQAWGWLLQRTI
jgi:hypothetical protein